MKIANPYYMWKQIHSYRSATVTKSVERERESDKPITMADPIDRSTKSRARGSKMANHTILRAAQYLIEQGSEVVVRPSSVKQGIRDMIGAVLLGWAIGAKVRIANGGVTIRA